MLGMVEGLLHEPGERLGTLFFNFGAYPTDKREISVLRVQHPTLNAQLSTVNFCALNSAVDGGRSAVDVSLVNSSAFETDQHIPQTAAGLSLSAAVVFQTVVLYSRRDSGGGGAFCNSFLFQRRLRSKSAGQRVRLEQARANGIGQCDSRSQRD